MGDQRIYASILVALLVAASAHSISKRLLVTTIPKNAPKSYIIEVKEQSTGNAAAAEEPIEPLLVKADIAHGEQLFKQCAQCHTPNKGGAHKLGPNLWGIVGNALAHAADYAYSDGLKKKKEECKQWTYHNLGELLRKPRTFIPGTKMSFAGLVKAKDRADLIAYLRTQHDSPPELPKCETNDDKQLEPEKTEAPHKEQSKL